MLTIHLVNFVMSTHTHRIRNKKQLELNTEIAEIFRIVPYEKGFHFYTALDNFTGETATSLEDFEKKLKLVPIVSVSFHLKRGDFQKWIANTLGDYELCRRVSSIKLARQNEDLRKELLAMLQTRITELRRELPHLLRHTHS